MVTARYSSRKILLILSFSLTFVYCEQLECTKQSDCSQNYCCTNGYCKYVSDSTLSSYCSSQSSCYASQCQYGCCNSNQTCGSYSDCSSDTRNIQITIAVIVGSVIFVLLLCYIYAICKKRKSNQVGIMQDEEQAENNSNNIQGNNQDATSFLNQTNANQTQVVMLNNNNQTSITEINQNAANSTITKPTHVLPPIQTIFLIDQNQNFPIYVQRKLDANEVNSINHSIQGTRVSKEYFLKKKKSRAHQRGNSLNQSNLQQSNTFEQRRSQEGDQIASFSRYDQQSQSQYNNINLGRQVTVQSQNQDSMQEDMLKNPDNYIYRVLRDLRQQAFINKRQKYNQLRHMHSESDLVNRSSQEKKRIQSLHANQYDDIYKRGMTERTFENIKDNVTISDYDELRDYNRRRNQEKKNQTQSQMEQDNSYSDLSVQYQQEITITRDRRVMQRQKISQRPSRQFDDSHQIQEDEELKEQEMNSSPNQRSANKGEFLNSLKQTNSYNENDTLATPHQEITVRTPHAQNDNSHRQLNSPERTAQASNPYSRNSINSNKLLQILQNQVNDDSQILNNQDITSQNNNMLAVPSSFKVSYQDRHQKKDVQNKDQPKIIINNSLFENPDNQNIKQEEQEQQQQQNRQTKKERKSQSSNDDDIVSTINKIYADDDIKGDDFNIQSSQAKSSIIQQDNFRMQDLLGLEQQKSRDISDSIYELEKQIDDINRSEQEKERTNGMSSSNIKSDGKSQKLEMINNSNYNNQNDEDDFEQFRLSQISRKQNSQIETITQNPRILTLSQFQQS